MLKLIFTLDYEIHGNGEGNPFDLMVEPTYRLMDILDEYGAKLVIFADIAEIIKFKEYRDQFGKDGYSYEKIIYQLRDAVLRGHDVQLHLHSSYFDSYFQSGKWVQNWAIYNLATLSFEEIDHFIKITKKILEEEIIKPVKPDYECYIFRASNWSMQPTRNIAYALLNNGICIDSSVYKYGKQTGWVDYDYTDAYNETFPYKASIEDICQFDPISKLVEFPIHCEMKYLISFITPIRIFRAIRALRHRHDENDQKSNKNKISACSNGKIYSKFTKLMPSTYPRKFDFNQLTGKQMIKALKKIKNDADKLNYVTLIGHSKTFIKLNEKSLKEFLNFVDKNRKDYNYALYPKRYEIFM